MIYRMFKITCKAQTEQSTLIYSLHIWAPLCFILDSLLLFGLFFFCFCFCFSCKSLGILCAILCTKFKKKKKKKKTLLKYFFFK